MKTKKYHLGLAIIIGILCAPILSETEPDLPDRTLLGQPNPALTGINTLYVWITPHDLEPNSHGPGLGRLHRVAQRPGTT